MNKLKLIVYTLCLSPIFVILISWWSNSSWQSASSVFISLGRVYGLLGTYFILIQFLLRARIQPFEKIIGFMQIDRIHKKNGYIAITLLLLHPIFLLIGYSLNSRISIIDQFLIFISRFDGVLNAFIGLVLFIVVICTSVYIVRRKMPYHWWYFVHLLTYLAIFLAFGHQLTNGEDFIANPAFAYFWYFLYALVFGATLYWKIIRVGMMYVKNRFYIAEVVKETYDTTSLYIKGRHVDSIQYQAGQFAFIHILNKDLWWDVHPFSISCAPNGEYIRFTIKSSGDYTRKIPDVVVNTPVILDMPHGEFTLSQAVTRKLLFIAGGVGLTPLRAMLESAGKDFDSVLIFANKTDADIILRSELEKLSVENSVPIHHVMSGDPNYPGLKGYVTIPLLEQTVPDFKERDIFMCGPPVMMKLVIAALREAGVNDNLIHSEKFSL
ncbi:MAG: ferredoxin reductase family protein [bacterium]|nr:ferredoxin reductase family protein [bacterium]